MLPKSCNDSLLTTNHLFTLRIPIEYEDLINDDEAYYIAYYVDVNQLAIDE